MSDKAGLTMDEDGKRTGLIAEARQSLEAGRDDDRRMGRRKRKPSLVSVAKQAAKAGLEVARYEVDPDGKITVVTGKPGDVTTGNPWDEVLTKNVTH
jgi:hypothetical protein